MSTVIVTCKGCGVEIPGRANRVGEVRADRSRRRMPRPRVPGYCMQCVPHAALIRLVGRDLWDVIGVVAE